MIRALLQARPVLGTPSWHLMWLRARPFQNKAYERDFDPDELAEARKWRDSFDGSSLPKGQTIYSRSSGPGGQHVNKFVIYP